MVNAITLTSVIDDFIFNSLRVRIPTVTRGNYRIINPKKDLKNHPQHS
jgi:hypothetical protein